MLISIKFFIFVITSIVITGCASSFPTPSNSPIDKASLLTLNGEHLFKKTLSAHGGDNLDQLTDVSVAITGEWKTLITKIQPLVTDYTYRVDSEERLLLKPYGYSALYRGPAGTKKVVRTSDSIEVYYNGVRSSAPDVLSSTALTADAFHLFLLGPLSLKDYTGQFVRIADHNYNGQSYYRIHIEKTPGFGFSKKDQVVLWINQDTHLTESVQITLMGHESTRQAHVQVDYLDFISIDSFVFPKSFFESVNAPISIDAHEWVLEGIDINRGFDAKDIAGSNYKHSAQRKATRVP